MNIVRQEVPQVADRAMTAGQYSARWRALANLLKMGHCAPSVMQTILDVTGDAQEWPVKLSAGLPGGIGNIGFECGGVTAPLVMLGLRYGLRGMHDGLPEVLYAGHEYCRRFRTCQGTLFCKDIRGERRLPIPCIGAVRHSPELYIETSFGEHGDSLTGERKDAFRRLYAHLSERGFHCSHAVLKRLSLDIPPTEALLDATSGFMGGTLFQGYTCSALTAGIMAAGLKRGAIENSRLRVVRMIAVMAVGGNAFDDDMNEFNRIMNIGSRLSTWFAGELGSTRCQALTGCNFSTLEGVAKYAENGCATKCGVVAEKVARKVEGILEEGGASSAPAADGCCSLGAGRS